MHHIEDTLAKGLGFQLLRLVKNSRLFSKLAWWTLEQYQAITKTTPNAYRQLAQIEPAQPASLEGKRVLIFTLRGWTSHMAWESTIARALQLRGAHTLTIICDRVLPACEARTFFDDYQSTCDRCFGQAEAFMSKTGLDYQILSQFLSPNIIAEAHAIAENLSYDELVKFKYDDLPLGELVTASVSRHLLRGNLLAEPETIAAYRRFVTAAIITLHASKGLLDDYRPTSILVLNGLFYAEAVLMAEANRRAIPVWSYERGKHIDSLIFAKNAPANKRVFEEEWITRRDKQLTDGQKRILIQYLDERISGHVGIERLWPQMQEIDTVQQNRPTAVLFTNVLWDTAVYQSDIGFSSMIDWVVHNIQWFKQYPAYNLIVRIHPAEQRIPFKTSRSPVLDSIKPHIDTIPDNVRIVSPDEALNSYELLNIADIVLVYTSTIGLEATLKGITTIVAGKTHYRHKGFTVDPDTKEQYAASLNQVFAENGMSDAQLELAQRYAYLFFYEQMLPLSLVHEEPRSYITFNYTKNEELRPGKNGTLDMICNAILERPSVIA